jgi:hypothetical protein
VEEQAVDLYWPMLVAAAALVCTGALFLRSRAELAFTLAGAAVVAAVVFNLTR